MPQRHHQIPPTAADRHQNYRQLATLTADLAWRQYRREQQVVFEVGFFGALACPLAVTATGHMPVLLGLVGLCFAFFVSCLVAYALPPSQAIAERRWAKSTAIEVGDSLSFRVPYRVLLNSVRPQPVGASVAFSGPDGCRYVVASHAKRFERSDAQHGGRGFGSTVVTTVLREV